MTAPERPRAFKFGWFGDNGLGDALIGKILSGEKTASMCPAYDPEDAEKDETLHIIDKKGDTRAKIKVVHIETRPFGEVNEDIARRLGSSLDDIRRIFSYAQSRPIREDEEMRIVYFELLEVR